MKGISGGRHVWCDVQFAKNKWHLQRANNSKLVINSFDILSLSDKLTIYAKRQTNGISIHIYIYVYLINWIQEEGGMAPTSIPSCLSWPTTSAKLFKKFSLKADICLQTKINYPQVGLKSLVLDDN